jgi:demethylmenaquinone methyltransferase/2-methoxy-6-polyprenyl-1,4-benzoquinol methylase
MEPDGVEVSGRIGKDPKAVGAMFSSIAPVYDRLNRALSLWQDVAWRRQLVRGADLPERGLVLDLCTGTGDIAIGFITERLDFKGLVLAVDFSAMMVDRARGKLAKLGAPYASRVEFLMGDALDLQYPDEKFDVVAVAFGVRNFFDVPRGLKEIHRVLKVGGQVNILEFFPGQTRGPARWYARRFVPWIGSLVSGTSAYWYLERSSDEFYRPEDFEQLLAAQGFLEISWERLTFGVAHIVRARKRTVTR